MYYKFCLKPTYTDNQAHEREQVGLKILNYWFYCHNSKLFQFFNTFSLTRILPHWVFQAISE